MVTFGNRLLTLATLCTAGPALSFAPSLCRVRGQGQHGIASHETATRGGTSRRCPRRPLPRNKFLRAAESQEGHEVTTEGNGGEQTLPLIGERPFDKRSKWARGQGDWRKPPKDASQPSREDDVVALMEVEPQGLNSLSPGTGPGPGEGAGEMPLAEAQEHEGEGNDQPVLTKKRVKKFFQKDFDNSSWTVAIQWRNKPYEVSTTKMFLKDDGSVVWLNKARGEWKIRPKTRNLSVYRQFFFNWNGVRIFSAKLLENTCDMYLEGEIKGWTPFAPLSVMGWFQAVRRGIVVDENTPRPPWEDSEPPSQDEFKRKRFAKEIVVPVDLE